MFKLKKSSDYFLDMAIYGLIMFIVGGVVYFYTLNIPSFDIAIQGSRLGLLAFLGFILAATGALIGFVAAIFWYLTKSHSTDT
ncbi:hypothetical protein [Pelagibius sp. Alg239-R121]|uniref:hypothetical protein n=1 Tax=Pelagibius sp. Alg239-R121 TaxID=2993448 RepID=UPI0024A6F847|nr:hypothetical protein [Pelagibius sp. Alg239-R121]